jgi:Tol biopolymer transport system component
MRSQIHVKNSNGSNDVALTHDIWANVKPAWSPDGTRLAFLSERDGKYNSLALYLMAADGSNVQKLTEPLYSDTVSFSWSPDGQQIVIESDLPVGNLTIIDIKTGNTSTLLNLPAGETVSAPAWQP